MPEQKQFEEKDEGMAMRILGGIWNAIKLICKGMWWVAMAWWKYLDKIASSNPDDFGVKTQTQTTQQPSLTSKKVETVIINGKPYYKSKDGQFKPLDV